MREILKGNFWGKLLIVCALLIYALALTGCGVSEKERENILSALMQEGYIGEDDDLEYEGYERESLTLSVTHYDYYYRDGDGDLYYVCIQPSYNESVKHSVFIYYGVEIKKGATESGEEDGQTREEGAEWIMEDYDSCIELRAEPKQLLLWKYAEISEPEED